MDLIEETERARIHQFKQDRWFYVIGQIGATVAIIVVAWPVADHSRLLLFGVIHHLATWVLAFGFFKPFHSRDINKLPLSTYIGLIVVNLVLSSALLLDAAAAARDLSFTLAVGIVLYAVAAGSFVTLGVHSLLMRVALSSLLLPYIVATIHFGHVAVGLGSLFFYLNIVVAGVWKLSKGHQELISLRIDATKRAELAQIDADTDHLTGLLNRRGVERLEGTELKHGATAFYFDLNKFKFINDTYGHAVGDEILQAVGERLTGAVASNDVVARLGGDEFFVLILDEHLVSADSIGNWFNERLQQPIKVTGGHLLSVGAAIGYSHTSKSVLELNELLGDSDRAMYQAKQSVGNNRLLNNCVVTYGKVQTEDKYEMP